MNSIYATQNQAIRKLQEKLRQRDSVLFAVLSKCGPQTFFTEAIDVPVGAMVSCHVNVDQESVTFTAVKPREIKYEEVQASQEDGSQKV